MPQIQGTACNRSTDSFHPWFDRNKGLFKFRNYKEHRESTSGAHNWHYWGPQSGPRNQYHIEHIGNVRGRGVDFMHNIIKKHRMQTFGMQ